MILRSVFLTIIFYWFLFLTVLALLAPLQITIEPFLVGIAVFWAVFFILTLGYLSFGMETHKGCDRKYNSFKLNIDRNTSFKAFLFLFVPSLLLTMYAMYFYTGQTIFSLVTNLKLGNSLYSKYQSFFMEQGLMVFSFSKIPAIVSMILIKGILLWSFYVYVFLPVKIKRLNYVFLFLICLNYILFSLARGTNFELFEILLLVIFTVVYRAKYIWRSLFSIRLVIFLIFIFVSVLALYLSTIQARFVDGVIWKCSVALICLDTESFIYTLVPGIGLVLFALAGYFLFGVLYVSVFIQSFLFEMNHSFLYIFLPLGFNILGEDIIRESICGNLLDCGASWTPSIMIWLNSMGVLILGVVIFILGYIASAVEKGLSKHHFVLFVLLFYLVMLVVSLPVGDFVFISTSNSVIFFGAFIIYFLPPRVRRLLSSLNFRRRS